jgi:hypothetical protein
VNREQLPSYEQYLADVNDEQVAEKIRHDTYEQDEERDDVPLIQLARTTKRIKQSPTSN